ncbi:hypothetical protein VDGD_09538 [Verticillium dahliae]|nr:hypothetical protein VdG1_06857 [Verticillium dahliae VDG1]RBQ97846.1 hypothetical protein VDGD_09538 [Verticillium dahliae]
MSTLLPFLYHTRTLQRATSKTPLALTSLRCYHASSLRANRRSQDRNLDTIPFEWAGEPAKEPSRHEGNAENHDGTRRERNKRHASTITPTEKRAFNDIFADLAKRSRNGALFPGLGPDAPQDSQDRTMRALREALGTQNQDISSASADADTPEWMLKYPASLRRSVRAALGHKTRVQEAVAAEENKPVEVDPLVQEQLAAQNQAREAEIERFDSLVRECRTDLDVWNVLNREVFSMIDKLGVADVSTVAAEETQEKLDMNLYGPLYSQHLLRALKALDTEFARSSPLVFNLLPRVRELGFASYVLGATTSFFNELATIYWRRNGDVRGVIGLLQEMQHAGLSFDKGTLELVRAIEASLDGMASESQGPFTQVLATMPDYSFDVRAQLTSLVNKIIPAVRDDRS